MRPHEDSPAADPGQVFDLPYPLPDLHTGTVFQIRRDRPARKIYISGFLKNIGNKPIEQSFLVLLDVEVRRIGDPDNTLVTSGSRQSVVEGAPVGETIRTVETGVDYHSSARYYCRLEVDVNNDISELRSDNNIGSTTFSTPHEDPE